MKCDGSGLPYLDAPCPICGQELKETKFREYPTHWNPTGPEDE